MRNWLVGMGVTLLVCACENGAPTGGIHVPRHFIADHLGPACLRDDQGGGRSAAKARAALQALYDQHQRYITDLRASNSLTVNKDAYAAHWPVILFNSYAAAAGDPGLARTILDGLGQLARAERYLTEPGLLTMAEAKALPACYSQGPDTPCPTHTPRFVAQMYANLMISAAVLKPHMTEADQAVLIPWVRAGYAKFVGPEVRADQSGLYDFADMGMAELAYATLTEDAGRAQRELAYRRGDFLRHIESSGYIDQNSFRGVRGFWYHTYGLDPALSYALVAREWGVDYFADPTLGPRLRAAVEKTALGIRDYAAFRAPGNRGTAYSTDPRDTRAFVHQYALNLYEIAEREFGIRLPPDPEHKSKAAMESYSQIAGLSARCYYSGR